MNLNKKIICILIVIVLVIFCSIVMFSFMGTSHAYKNFTCNDTGTVFEVPVDLKVRQDQSVAGIRSSIMSTTDGNIVIERQVGNNPYIDDTMEGARDLLNSYDGDNVNGVTIHTYSRTAKNNVTGEVILVTSNNGDNETVDHIINSIKWGNNTVKTNDSNGTVASVNTNTGNSDKQFTQEDLDKARDEGYWNGYDDSYYDQSQYYEDYDSYGYSSYSDSGSSSSESGSSESSSYSSDSNIETTVDE